MLVRGAGALWGLFRAVLRRAPAGGFLGAPGRAGKAAKRKPAGAAREDTRAAGAVALGPLGAPRTGEIVVTVYVDPSRHPYGRMIMCHMWADTEAELHAFAERLGLRRAWFQEPPKARWKHYDICRSKRALAVKLGAVETDIYGPSEFLARQSGNGLLLAQIALRRARRAHAVEMAKLL